MTGTRWLTDTQRDAWVRFAAVMELLPAALNAQLSRDENLTHFDYFVLAMLSEAPDHTLRMTSLATRTNATLPRLSRVVSRLEADGFIVRSPCPEDRRATNLALTARGWDKVVRSAPGHVAAVRRYVIDALTPDQVAQLAEISRSMLAHLDPDGRLCASG